MINAKPQSPLDLFTGLSKDALQASINYLNKEILTGTPHIGAAANFAYKLYCKTCSLEQFALGKRIKKLSRLQFQSKVDPVAQSIWAYGDRNHAHLF
jgi:hypothetical protein